MALNKRPPRTRVLILGAGGHAQVVADLLQQAAACGDDLQPIGFLDDAPGLIGSEVQGLPVLGALNDLPRVPHDAVIVAVGDNAARRRVFIALQAAGESFAIARHPRSIIAPGAVIGPGAMICAGAIVNPASVIGANTILNTGCTVDHHNQIGDHVHIAPGAHLGGEVWVGEGALVGIGATVSPRCRVGAWAVVGAGAAVIREVQADTTVVGVPARLLRSGLLAADKVS